MPAYRKLCVVLTAQAADVALDVITGWEDPPPLATTKFLHGNRGDWVVESYFDHHVADTELLPLVAMLKERLESAGDIVIVAVPDEDWTAKVQRDLAPVRAGRFIVHGSHDRARVRPSRWAIEIEAGEAFGTAHHATTQGCLIAIERLARARHVKSVVDVGCGTAVLAIAAAKVWPQAELAAGDVDPVAVGIARENARLNGVGRRIEAVVSAGLSAPALRGADRYDLVLANILAAPLIGLAPAFAHGLRRGGIAVLSGLLVEQAPEVLATYRSRGFRRLHLIRRGEWMTLVLIDEAGPQSPIALRHVPSPPHEW